MFAPSVRSQRVSTRTTTLYLRIQYCNYHCDANCTQHSPNHHNIAALSSVVKPRMEACEWCLTHVAHPSSTALRPSLNAPTAEAGASPSSLLPLSDDALLLASRFPSPRGPRGRPRGASEVQHVGLAQEVGHAADLGTAATKKWWCPTMGKPQ